MSEKVKILDGETVEDLHRNGYHIIQSPNKFRFGCDAVLLSDFAKVKKGETVLDVGTGTGIIPILLEAKTKGKEFFALEIQKESADMASRSVLLNNLEEKIKIIVGDIKEVTKYFKKASFDVVTSNPPYMNSGGGILNENSASAIARHEVLCSLDDVVKGASDCLKTNGRFYLIHRPHRLTEIFASCSKYNLEPKTMRLVFPKQDKEPTMVLIEAIKNAKPMLKVLKPLIMYNNNGEYTSEIVKIYYDEIKS